MPKNHAFRPRLSEILEARAVPSMAGVLTPTGIPGISVALPPQLSASNPQVKAAFVAFDQSYIHAVDSVLLAPGADGLVVPLRNQAAFDAAIEQSVDTLARQLIQALNTGSTGSTGSTPSTGSTTTTTSTAETQVTAAIVGTSTTSLVNQLLALPVGTIGVSVPGVSTTTAGSSQTVVANVVSTAEQVRVTNRVPVAESTGASTTTGGTSTSSSSSSSSQASDDVRSAFGNFLEDYFKAVQGVLLAPGSNGQVNPQANRVSFDARVNQALQSLETRLSTTLGRDPATTGLGPQVRSTIDGDATSSLKNRLASLATPAGAQATVVRDFTLSSTRAIAQVLSMISGDVSKVIRPAGQ